MAHAFPPEEMPDAKRARRAAEWIETGILDLSRARDLAEGRVCHADVTDLIGRAKTLADNLRKSPAGIAPTPKE